MKQKFKKTKFLFYVAILIAIGSCTSEEEVVHQHSHDEKVKIERRTIGELMKQADFSRAMKKLPKKSKAVKNSSGRTEIEDQYDFEFVDVPAKVLYSEGKTYYTMQIVTEGNIDNKLENLFLYSEPEDENIGYIITYNIDKDAVKTEASIKQEGIKELEALIEEGSAAEGGKFVIVSFFYSLCNGIPFDCGGSICGTGYYQDTIWVPDFDSSPGGNSGGSSGSGGGSSGGNSGGGGGNSGNGPGPSNPNLPVLTSPVFSGDETVVVIVNPCEKLKTKTNNLVFKNKVAQLKTPNVLALDHEKGFIETVPSAGANAYKDVEGNSNQHTIYIPAILRAIGSTHTHNNDYVNRNGKLVNTFKMPSPDDLQVLIDHQNNALSQGLSISDAYVIMLSSQGHFAIKLLERVDSDVLTKEQWVKFNNEYYKNATKMIEEGTLNSINLQKMLLSLLKEKGLYDKIALYKATNDEATQWSRVTLNPVNPNNAPINTPCN